MIADIGKCETRRQVQEEVQHYKDRWFNSDRPLGSGLLSFSGRRILHVAFGYFADAQPPAGR
jgi:hypothetical protein